MPQPAFERHGVYHVATRGGHEITIVVIDDGKGFVEGFVSEVRDANPDDVGDKTIRNGRVAIVDEVVTIADDAVDLTVYFGNLRTQFEEVDFVETDEPHSSRYSNLADAYDKSARVERASDVDEFEDDSGTTAGATATPSIDETVVREDDEGGSDE